ncbi:MAG: WD40 repeat domain-containing protein [Planctomycetes bacterium]|nr:WD40 repeat domain-containing protein [Planctomycetota bacterium]
MSGLFSRSGPPSADGAITPARTRMALELRHNSPLVGCRFDPTGRFVFAGAQDNTIQRWELAAPNAKVAFSGHRSWVRGLAFVPSLTPNPSPGGRATQGGKLLSADWNGKVLVWPFDATAAPQPERILDAHDGWARAIVMSRDNRQFATCGNDNLVKVWNVADFTLARQFEGHTCHVYNVAFHPDGRHLVSGDLRGNIKQWDLQTGREVRQMDASVIFRYDPTFRADHGGVRSMTFNADGSLLACAGITNVSNAFAGIGNPAIVLFNWQTGQRSQVLRVNPAFQGTAWGVVFHPSGFVIGAGAGSGGGLWFWRPTEANSIQNIAVPNNARDLAITPDQGRLAVPCFDGVVRIYELS